MKKTGIKAYRELIKSGKLSPRKAEVLMALAEDGAMTATELSLALGVPRDSVSPRIAELRRSGLVTTKKTTACEITGKTVSVWETTGHTRLKNKKATTPARWYVVKFDKSDDALAYVRREDAERYVSMVGGRIVETVERT